MIDPHFVWVGVALSLIGSSFYIHAVIARAVTPNLVTWILWAAMPLIAFAAQIEEGVGLSALLTLSVGLGPAMVVITSLLVNRGGYWRFSRLDLVCGCISIAALTLWAAFDNPVMAIIMVIVADVVAAIPTVRKSWRTPRTERSGYYVLAALNGTITLLTLDSWTVADWAFPVYIIGIASLIATVVHTRGRHLGSRPSQETAQALA